MNLAQLLRSLKVDHQEVVNQWLDRHPAYRLEITNEMLDIKDNVGNLVACGWDWQDLLTCKLFRE